MLKTLVTLKLTRTYLHTRQSEDHPGNIVLIQETCPPKFFRQFDLSNHPQTMPPTFLFLLYKIVKEQTISNRRKSQLAHKARRQSPNPKVKSCQRLVCGAGLLDQSNQPVNHFFEENHKLNRSSFLLTSTRLNAPSTPPAYQHPASLPDTFNQLQGRISLPLAAPPPSLWRHIDPTKQNCQRSFSKTGIFFPQPIWSF